jgi:hypothetical protein
MMGLRKITEANQTPSGITPDGLPVAAGSRRTVTAFATPSRKTILLKKP